MARATYEATILTLAGGETRKTYQSSTMLVAIRDAARFAGADRKGQIGEAVSIRVVRKS